MERQLMMNHLRRYFSRAPLCAKVITIADNAVVDRLVREGFVGKLTRSAKRGHRRGWHELLG